MEGFAGGWAAGRETIAAFNDLASLAKQGDASKRRKAAAELPHSTKGKVLDGFGYFVAGPHFLAVSRVRLTIFAAREPVVVLGGQVGADGVCEADSGRVGGLLWGRSFGALFESVDAFLIVIGEAGEPAFVDGADFFSRGEPFALFNAEGIAFGACEFSEERFIESI